MIYYVFLFLEFLYPSFNNVFDLPYSSTVYRTLLLVLSVLVTIMFAKFVLKRNTSTQFILIIFTTLLISIFIGLTISKYNKLSYVALVNYSTFILRTIPSVFIVPILLEKSKNWHLQKIKILYFFTGFSLLLFIIRNITTTFHWATINYGGINYNDFTFVSAINILFGIVLIENKIKTKTLSRTLFFVLLILLLSFATLFLSAGRSGIISAIMIVVIFIFRNFINFRIKISKFILSSFLIVVIFIFFSLLSRNSKFELVSAGLERAVGFINLGNTGPLINWSNTSSRLPIYQDSLKLFFERPILGHGIGSVYMIHPTAYFSHNIFLDLLIEGGIMLLIIFILIIFKSLLNYKKYEVTFHSEMSLYVLVLTFIKLFTGSNYLVEPLFFCSIVMLLMSGHKYKLNESKN